MMRTEQIYILFRMMLTIPIAFIVGALFLGIPSVLIRTIFRKKKDKRKIFKTFLISGMVVLVISVGHDVFEIVRVNYKIKDYERSILSQYSIEEFSLNNDSYELKMKVPEFKEYNLRITAYQNDKCRTLYGSDNNSAKVAHIFLDEGENTISGYLNDISYENDNLCVGSVNIINELSTIPPNIHLGKLDEDTATDIVVHISDSNSINDFEEYAKSMFIWPMLYTKIESIYFYSSRLAKSNACPFMDSFSFSTCAKNSLLSIN